jgi:hypothetical protein
MASARKSWSDRALMRSGFPAIARIGFIDIVFVPKIHEANELQPAMHIIFIDEERRDLLVRGRATPATQSTPPQVPMFSSRNRNCVLPSWTSTTCN